jgi:hypothetical protein
LPNRGASSNGASRNGTDLLAALTPSVTAQLMFLLPVVDLSMKIRAGEVQWFSEFVTTFRLVATIPAGIRFERKAVPSLVGLYITAT